MQKINKTSFINALAGVCVSVEIFQKLKQQKVWRTLLHFGFLAFLCSFFIMLAGHGYMLEEIDKPLDIFEKSAGGIVLRDGGFYPEKEPEKAYEIMLSPLIKLVYSPRFALFNSDWINKNGITILWFPRFWCVTMTSSQTLRMRVFSGFPDSSMQEMLDIDDRDELMEYLEKRSIEADKKVKKTDGKSFMVSRLEIEKFYLGGRFFYYWFEFCIQALFCTLLFSVFYRFVGARSNTKLKFSEIFCSSFYAAMPPMLIASFFPALDLPFLQFNTVFLIGYFIYFLYVLNYLEQNATENSSLQKGD